VTVHTARSESDRHRLRRKRRSPDGHAVARPAWKGGRSAGSSPAAPRVRRMRRRELPSRHRHRAHLTALFGLRRLGSATYGIPGVPRKGGRFPPKAGTGHDHRGESSALLVSPPGVQRVDGDVSTSSTSPILPGTAQHDTGSDSAPSGIVVRSCITTGDRTLVVHLAGEIDHFSAGPLRAILASAAADGHRDLVLDTSQVTFCDSGFLGILDWWPHHGRRLRLEARSPAVQRLLNVAGPARKPDARTRKPRCGPAGYGAPPAPTVSALRQPRGRTATTSTAGTS
jgi:stage II sporulation protein AA (anti-sigma F factor antagonist)